MAETGVKVGIDEFRVRCLDLIDHVRTTGEPVVVTRMGSPVVRLLPCAPVRQDAGDAEDDPWTPCWDPEAVE